MDPEMKPGFGHAGDALTGNALGSDRPLRQAGLPLFKPLIRG
jgi:hypothetical protein